MSIAALSIFVSAWRLTGRRPLFYDLFLVEIHSWGARRFVQVLQLGQEFRPLGSWSEVMARMRSRAPPVAFDTNVVIQSPATVMDESTASFSIPSPSSSTLWEIEMPVATSGGGSDVSHESHFAAAAAIAVLGRGFFFDGRNSLPYLSYPCETSIEKHEEEEDHGNSSVEAEGDSVIRLKFLDDTQRDARTTMTDTIGKFKSVHFGDAVAAGRVVRLIYQGQLLREDSRTLASYGLRDGCVVHCHISNTPYRFYNYFYTIPPISLLLVLGPIYFGASVLLLWIETSRRRSQQCTFHVQSQGFTLVIAAEKAACYSLKPTRGVTIAASEFRYPRWAVAVLLYTYRFPLIGVPLDAIIRFMFDRQMAPSAEPGVFRRTYQRYFLLEFGDFIAPFRSA
ncbi:unnamed protein product [Haemonchus placei]|uniref:Ubiquitin-like domain-containing protein n=1 Tax=Haemonchus placei TaxID=6290 RepID=A0A3P7WY03_HAEPC|nr:unnamed protein product [Haemonchus placei]